MLPPVEDSVLQSNPDFAALYKTLTTAVLNPDGSTKNDPATKERNAVREELKYYRLEAARQHLFVHAISTANPNPRDAKPPPAPALNRRAKLAQSQASRQSTPSSELPAPLLDLLLLLPPFLTAPPSALSPDSTALLLSSPPFSLLPSLLPPLAALISSTLHASAVHLARIANPTTNPSFVHRSVPSVPSHVAGLASSIATRKTALTKSRLAAATALTSLLHTNAQALSHLLRALEAKHGPIARSLEFRATEAALSAQRQGYEAATAMWVVRRETYTPEAVRALGNYAGHLRDAKGRMGEAMRTLRAELEGYGVDVYQEGAMGGKEKMMREMARVYRDMGRQVEEVRGDLERLGRA
ncbi:hypothetical protein B0T25DRAFT_464082 [Lasiosphaeria hispida]|uniref:Uncharacterized protein n=1 Tax=Lasiosphaeria hispida TaxID=260671 RepID=A0AAJ0M949_9PEZI|nr:hypothetical protein B0T25DRAFT_464082 [Lasiosphaeria hispida]